MRGKTVSERVGRCAVGQAQMVAYATERFLGHRRVQAFAPPTEKKSTLCPGVMGGTQTDSG